jgi:hypothetical protein
VYLAGWLGVAWGEAFEALHVAPYGTCYTHVIMYLIQCLQYCNLVRMHIHNIPSLLPIE